MTLLLLDVDGVMTDGTKVYNTFGAVIAKRFRDQDFSAIKLLKEVGIKVCWLSSDERVNKLIAVGRGIDFVYSRKEDGTINKAELIPELLERYNVKAEDTIYVGDDYVDIPMFDALHKAGGTCYCVNNAPESVKTISYVEVLETKGGEGVAVELYELYLRGHL